MRKDDQKKILFPLALIVLVFIFFQWVIVPLKSYKQDTKQEIRKNQVRLQELIELEAKLSSVQKGASPSKVQGARDKDFTLFAFLEQLASRKGLKDNIEFMRPSSRQVSDHLKENIVELRLKEIYLSELVPYLYHVENAPEKVFIKRMTVRRQDKAKAPLNVDLVFSTLFSSVEG